MMARTEIAWRAIAGAGAAMFLLLSVAAFRHPDLGVTARALMGLLLAATAVRPGIGLMIAAALLPFVPPLQTWLDLDDVAEPTLLLFTPMLGAALARLAAARVLPQGSLQYPAIALIAVIAADAVVRLPVIAPAGVLTVSFADRVFTHMTATYFTARDGFGMFHPHVAWIAAVTLAAVVELIMVAESRVRRPVVRLAITGAAGLALFSINRVIEVALRSTNPIATTIDVVTAVRFTPFHPDINAAGSLYVLLAVPPLWRVLATGGYGYLLAAVPLAAALWFSGSRAALLAAPAGLIVAWVVSRRLRRRAMAVTLLAVVAGTIALALVSTRTGQAAARTALDIRVDLVRVGLHVAALDPVFGVGLGRFELMSARYISPELAANFPAAADGENAHNNFLQVLAELGVFGLGTFLWVLATPFVLAARHRTDRPPSGPALVGGLAAFAVTCLAGHPLLTAHVRWCFFLVVGLSAGLLASGQSAELARNGFAARAAATIALILLVSLSFRP